MTPKEENELICEKLLGWNRTGFDVPVSWISGDDQPFVMKAPRLTPSFDDWASVGLILDAFTKIDFGFKKMHIELFHSGLGGLWRFELMWPEGQINVIEQHTGPVAIRAAALQLIERGIDSFYREKNDIAD